jgi:putative modified peptide
MMNLDSRRDDSFVSEDALTSETLTARNAFSPQVADMLLEKLSTDDAFRSLFQQDTRAALAIVGHVTPAGDVGVPGRDPVMCAYNMQGLATKERISSAKESLRAYLTAPLPQAMFGLCL